MAIVTALVALIISILSGLGVGSGGLMVIYLALFTDTPQLAAQGINLLFFICSAGASLPIHLLSRKIFGTAVITMSLFGALGAVAGSLLSGVIDETILRKIFGLLLIASGILALKGSFVSKK